MSQSLKLFIPGPVEVSPETRAAFAQPMIGHRSQEFQELFGEVQPLLQKVFFTQQPCFVSTSSAWGLMEGALRNLVSKKVLCCMSGAFSDKWLDVARKCGKKAEPYQVEWGHPILPEAIEDHLRTGQFDAITLVHNETSTGTMNPLEDIAAVLRRYPEVQFIVDCVSSFTTVPIPFDELGIDVLLAGTQKALALPAGASVFTVSEKAYTKAATLEDRGYYFDFLEFRKNAEKKMTPTTPSISHFYALKSKLTEIIQEGLENRYERHRQTNTLVHEWAHQQGFSLFPQPGYASRSLTCLRNDPGIDIPGLITHLRQNHHCVIDGGYGKIKGKTFRISNMGDETIHSMQQLLGWIDEYLRA